MNPVPCPKCGKISPCVDWCEVDIGVGVQTFDHEYECTEHGGFSFVSATYFDRAEAVFLRDAGKS